LNIRSCVLYMANIAVRYTLTFMATGIAKR